MHIEQIYTGCLAQGAYYIRSGNEAAIIDPLREIQPYLDRAKADGVNIKYVFETHFHADFVSGHLTLSKATGAPIVFGPNANPSFDAHIATDGESFKIGDVTIKALHTPGHTMESTTYLLKDKTGKDHAIFSGDTLFLGDVGRPDLAQKGIDLTIEDLASHLYNSLRSKIMPLADDVLVYPAHGAGSACGKNMSSETIGTIGEQKKTNYALRENMTRSEFVEEVTDGLQAPPAYFPLNVKLNKEGYEDIDTVLSRGARPLSADELEDLVNETGALVLDVRGREEFSKGHIPRSIFIGIDGGFAPWVGALIKDVLQKIILVVEPGREEEVITRLARVGFDHTIGYLDGGFETWKASGKDYDTINVIDPDHLKTRIESSEANVFDVRKPNEWENGHIKISNNTPLGSLNEHLGEFPEKGTFYLHCQSGYRSMIASSILKARGIHNFKEVRGGWKAIKVEMPDLIEEKN